MGFVLLSLYDVYNKFIASRYVVTKKLVSISGIATTNIHRNVAEVVIGSFKHLLSFNILLLSESKLVKSMLIVLVI